MIKSKEHFHGSDLEKIEKIYGIKKEDIISFSANVNPLGISPLLRKELSYKIDAITSYPDREYTELRKSICNYTGADFHKIIVGNGTTELISLFIQSICPKRALILGPTYSEYEREISLSNGQTLYYPLKEEHNFKLDINDFCSQFDETIHLVVLCNPNNPTASAISKKDMEYILKVADKYNIIVMVDETYVEFSPETMNISAIPLTNSYNNLIILRGISKFFASPGLRLGYAITGNSDLINYINTKKNPWTINSLAEVAGCIMFSDQDYIEKTKTLISTERERITSLLSTWDCLKVYPTYANFVLVKILKDDITADQIFDFCIKKGLMIRDCSDFPYLDSSFIRFCIMNPEQNDALIQALKECLKIS